jgi:hypothetical protein
MSDPNMGRIDPWIDEICGQDFYNEIPHSDDHCHVGQFFKTHIKYPFAQSPKVLEIESFDPTNELETIFKIADYDPESDTQRMRPIKQLNLKSTDRLYISAGKIRTVILLKISENFWMENESVKLALCIPISSFKSWMDPSLIVRTQLFEIPQYFYIKASESGARAESVARFDLIQYVCFDHIEAVQNDRSNSRFKLSSFSLKLMFNHLSNYIFEKPYDDAIDQEIYAYRDILNDEITRK